MCVTCDYSRLAEIKQLLQNTPSYFSASPRPQSFSLYYFILSWDHHLWSLAISYPVGGMGGWAAGWAGLGRKRNCVAISSKCDWYPVILVGRKKSIYFTRYSDHHSRCIGPFTCRHMNLLCWFSWRWRDTGCLQKIRFCCPVQGMTLNWSFISLIG